MISRVHTLQSRANLQQIKAVVAIDGAVIIIADPCFGKTFTLVERIVHRITNKGAVAE